MIDDTPDDTLLLVISTFDDSINWWRTRVESCARSFEAFEKYKDIPKIRLRLWTKIGFKKLHVDRHCPVDLYRVLSGPYFWKFDALGNLIPGYIHFSVRTDSITGIKWPSWVWALSGLKRAENDEDDDEGGAAGSMSRGKIAVITQLQSIGTPMGEPGRSLFDVESLTRRAMTPYIDWIGNQVSQECNVNILPHPTCPDLRALNLEIREMFNSQIESGIPEALANHRATQWFNAILKSGEGDGFLTVLKYQKGEHFLNTNTNINDFRVKVSNSSKHLFKGEEMYYDYRKPWEHKAVNTSLILCPALCSPGFDPRSEGLVAKKTNLRCRINPYTLLHQYNNRKLLCSFSQTGGPGNKTSCMFKMNMMDGLIHWYQEILFGLMTCVFPLFFQLLDAGVAVQNPQSRKLGGIIISLSREGKASYAPHEGGGVY